MVVIGGSQRREEENGTRESSIGFIANDESAAAPSAQPKHQASHTSTSRRKPPEHFTFSNVDVFNNSFSNRKEQFMSKFSTKRRKHTASHPSSSSSSCLWCGFMAILFCQTIMFLFQTSISNYYHNHNMATSHDELGLTLFLSSVQADRHDDDQVFGNEFRQKELNRNNNNVERSNGFRPRLLIGFFSDMGSDEKTRGTTKNSKTYRNRHRKLFRLWNDTRLCSYNAFRQRQRQLHAPANQQNHHATSQSSDEEVLMNDDECLILYTFVIGAHRNNHGSDGPSSSIPTLRLEATADEPLELEATTDDANTTTFIMLPSDLKKHGDFTLLNIRENMNDGKSPTFFAWAHSEATSPRNIGHQKSHNSLFSYAAKCDLDAMLRLDFVLQVLHKDLMWIPNNFNPNPLTAPPILPDSETTSLKISKPLRTDPTSVGGIVLGCLRHKAMWRNKTTNDDFWKANYQNGMHLYLGGQFYIVSNNLIPGPIHEARVQQQKSKKEIPKRLNYMAGHEDHDVLSMVQVAAVKNGQLVRWISMPRNYRFWQHPVKGQMWWKRIWGREERKAIEGRLPSRNKYVFPPTPESLPSLLVVLGAKDPKVRETYREKLITEQSRRRICSLKDYNTTGRGSSLCDLCYVFVVGGNDEGPNEIVRRTEELELLVGSQGIENDFVMLNVRDNVDSGMGQTVLYYLQTTFQGTLENDFDMIVFCNAQTVLLVEQWNTVQFQHARFHRNLIVGDVRDKDQLPVEFGTKRENETYFLLEQEKVHVYTGSDDACFGISTNLVEGILHHANESFGLSKDVEVIREDTSRKRKFSIFNPRAYFVENLGHDLSTLAYMTSSTVLHWIPISKGQAPWYHLP